MAARRKTPRREARIAFDTISIEGGLLSPEWISRLAQLAAGGQSEADYGVPRGLSLRDEIGRYWRIAQAHWGDFAAGRSSGADPRRVSQRSVVSFLREALGFDTLVPVPPVVQGERAWPIGFAALGGRVPVVIAPAAVGLDAPVPEFADGGRRRSPFGLAQEALNAIEGSLWGIACDGATLRILRDNESLTRPAWVEVDLERIFSEQRYADFAALWLLVHQSRFGRSDQPPAECALEAWRAAGREEGTRAREKLRQGVEQAVEALGQGFLSHPDNVALRGALHDGTLTTLAYFNELLRLVYRLIFLLTIEERGLLHPPGSDAGAQALYAEGYGLRRLRDRAIRRSAHDRHHDLWEAVRVVFRGLAVGEPRLALPALAGLFAPDQCPALDASRVENRALLLAMFRLSWLKEDSGLARVNWRDMGPEELGSVYEGLLELVPQVAEDGRTFRFASGDATKGNARKTTGSYYTPDSLVQVLLDSALEPVVTDAVAKHPDRPAAAILDLAVVDPACGSGHFLLAAARRLAGHVARHQANGTPSAAEYRHAVRQVVGRCIHGVDLNPMAVELCKVALWLEALEPGRPLTFLAHHVRCGNSLLGATPELIAGGLPDEAFDAIEGDDRKACTALRKRNKAERKGLGPLFALLDADMQAKVQQASAALEDLPEDRAEDLGVKEQAFRRHEDTPEYRWKKALADAWCAAFVIRKRFREAGREDSVFGITQRDLNVLSDGKALPADLSADVSSLAQQYRFFHWHLAFPRVFARGGFDVVLGNPPWERVKLQEQEFFASRDERIATAPNAAARKKLIAELPTADPALWAAWQEASRDAEGQSHLVRDSGRYPLCGKGDVNTYALFAEHNRQIVAPPGAMGNILPAGIATDDTTKDYFQAIVRSRTLLSMLHFENEERLFPTVNNMFRYVLLTLGGLRRTATAPAVVAFARNAATTRDPDRRYSLSAEEIEAINPNTGTFPTFFRRRDAEINLGIYRRSGVLWREGDPSGNPWGLNFLRMFDMANDSGLFRTRDELEAAGARLVGNKYHSGSRVLLPLYEGKMAHLFDHRYATYEGATQANMNKGTLPQCTDLKRADPDFQVLSEYWLDDADVVGRSGKRWACGWLLGWRDICRSTDVRTMVASLIARVAVGHTMPLMMPSVEPPLVAALYANLCSHALDYAARQKVGGTHLTYSFLKQLPILDPDVYSAVGRWHHATPLRDWILPRVLELTYTAWDLEPFARDVGWMGAPFRWDPARRFLLRCELDAAFFHLYGLSRDDADYVMDTFLVFRKNDQKAHGEYRTKRVILEIFDEMAAAIRTGVPYQTRLDPPPGDPLAAHPDTRGDR